MMTPHSSTPRPNIKPVLMPQSTHPLEIYDQPMFMENPIMPQQSPCPRTPKSPAKPVLTPRTTRALDIYSRARVIDLDSIARRRAAKVRKSDFGGARLADLSDDLDPNSTGVDVAAFESAIRAVSASNLEAGLALPAGSHIKRTPEEDRGRSAVTPSPASPTKAQAVARIAGQKASLQVYASTVNPITRKAGSIGRSRALIRVSSSSVRSPQSPDVAALPSSSNSVKVVMN